MERTKNESIEEELNPVSINTMQKLIDE